jgi:hypothetical protein
MIGGQVLGAVGETVGDAVGAADGAGSSRTGGVALGRECRLATPGVSALLG